jgi:hypothetical protein
VGKTGSARGGIGVYGSRYLLSNVTDRVQRRVCCVERSVSSVGLAIYTQCVGSRCVSHLALKSAG